MHLRDGGVSDVADVLSRTNESGLILFICAYGHIDMCVDACLCVGGFGACLLSCLGLGAHRQTGFLGREALCRDPSSRTENDIQVVRCSAGLRVRPC